MTDPIQEAVKRLRQLRSDVERLESANRSDGILRVLRQADEPTDVADIIETGPSATVDEPTTVADSDGTTIGAVQAGTWDAGVWGEDQWDGRVVARIPPRVTPLDPDRFSLTITDTDPHDLPDVDGDDSSGGGYWDGSDADRVAAYVTNEQDQLLSATLKRQAAPDESGDEIIEVPEVSVAPGETVALGADTATPMTQFRTVISFDAIPTGGVTVVRYEKD